ncbi:MAG: hypothetical protein H6738_21380 [Alphaproteobacteria bacterium]|nr:hypothetical protein [Alphaproteobacteria bacterium]
MRALVDRARLDRFLDELGRRVRVPTRFYLVGGASAVVEGWRGATVDVDFAAEPDTRELFEALPDLKNRLDLSCEPASPAHFVPELPGWRDRSVWIRSAGRLQVYHYDFTSQLLAKIERGHSQDLTDVQHMLDDGRVDPATALELFDRVEPELVRYPAIEPAAYRAKVEAILGPLLEDRP